MNNSIKMEHLGVPRFIGNPHIRSYKIIEVVIEIKLRGLTQSTLFIQMLPEQVWLTPEMALKYFLRRYFDPKGKLSNDEKNDNNDAEIKTSNPHQGPT